MAGTNGSTNGHEAAATMPIAVLAKPKRVHFSQQQVRALLEQLKVPFDPVVIQWKVVETAKAYGKLRGRVIPYADRLAYHERLNDCSNCLRPVTNHRPWCADVQTVPPPKEGDIVEHPLLGRVPLLSVYSRQQAIEDGTLVDCTQGIFDRAQQGSRSEL